MRKAFFVLSRYQLLRIVFIHPNFPGQYRTLLPLLARQAQHQVIGLSSECLQEAIPIGIQAFRYSISRGNSASIHPWALETEASIIRGESCARAAQAMKQQGLIPDLICAHPGWGESLFLRDIWPQAPIIHYQEFYYQPKDSDLDFDVTIQGEMVEAKLFARNGPKGTYSHF